jgi:hypothetical protein
LCETKTNITCGAADWKCECKIQTLQIKIAKTMKKDSSEVVATSSDLCDVDQTVLVLNDEKNIVINSKKRVRIYEN